MISKFTKPFFIKLRELGFKRSYVWKSKFEWDIQYKARFKYAEVTVQFMGLSNEDRFSARVSHFHASKLTGNPYAVSDSYPSEFKTIKGMEDAIRFEAIRYIKGISRTKLKKFE